MNKQINIRLSEQLLVKAEIETKKQGFANIQELIKELLRKTIYGTQGINSQELIFLKKLYKVSEKKNLYGTEKELFEKLNKK